MSPSLRSNASRSQSVVKAQCSADVGGVDGHLAAHSRATSFAGDVRQVMMARADPTRLIAAKITAAEIPSPSSPTQPLNAAMISRTNEEAVGLHLGAATRPPGLAVCAAERPYRKQLWLPCPTALRWRPHLRCFADGHSRDSPSGGGAGIGHGAYRSSTAPSPRTVTTDCAVRAQGVESDIQLVLPSRATFLGGEVRPEMMARTIPPRIIAPMSAQVVGVAA